MITLQEKENIVKTHIGKKAKMFYIQPTGQIGWMEVILKRYRILKTIVLVEYTIEGTEDTSVVNSDLLKVYNEEKKDYVDIW